MFATVWAKGGRWSDPPLSTPDRQVAILAMAGILKQLKRPTKKVAVKPSDISEQRQGPKYPTIGCNTCLLVVTSCPGGVEDPESPCAGDHEGNRWLQYDSRELPLSKARWDSLCYVEKTHWGYRCWPR